MPGVESDVKAHGIIAFYDVGDNSTFKSVQDQLRELTRYSNENVSKILIGTKSDSASRVDKQSVDEFASSLRIPTINVSAKNNINITESMELLVEHILIKMAR